MSEWSRRATDWQVLKRLARRDPTRLENPSRRTPQAWQQYDRSTFLDKRQFGRRFGARNATIPRSDGPSE
jgi:hypothetical protein